MPRYNEKADIWKVPDICRKLLGKNASQELKPALSDIHSKCKETDPSKRPSAEAMLEKYHQVRDILNQTKKENYE